MSRSSTHSRSHTSYARPQEPQYTTRLLPSKPILPLTAPPNSTTPDPPPRPAIPEIQGWKRTLESIPAAYPRSFLHTTGELRRESEPFRQASQGESKEDRQARIWENAQSFLTMRYDADEGSDGTGKEGLWMAGERWTREQDGRDDGEGVTLVVTHANGFHKESWHPTLRRLVGLGDIDPTSKFGTPPLASSASVNAAQKELRIDEILLLDDIHHGASIDLNAGKIGVVHNWIDGGRDVITAIEQRLKGKKVIGVGHSVGANAIVQAAHARPDLFQGIFLVEPMCVPIAAPRSSLSNPNNWFMVTGALKRRTCWPSLQAAEESMRSSPFYAKWHPEVFNLWLSHALVPYTASDGNIEDDCGAVQLATPSWAEAAVFAEPSHRGLAWDKLAEVVVPTGFVFAGDAKWMMGEEVAAEMAWRPKMAANERFMDAGHLIVQEKPDELADVLWRFIGNVVGLNSSSEESVKARL